MSLLTFTKQSSALFRSEPSLLYDVLTDYDVASEWMPSVARSKLLAKEGDLAIAEFEEAGKAKELFVVECIHTKNKMVLWRTIRGKIPLSEIRWDIEPAESGQSKVTLTIEGRTNLNRINPAYSRFLRPARFLKALESAISAYLPELAIEADGEKILEIAETNEGIVCWIRGQKYTMTPIPEGKS